MVSEFSLRLTERDAPCPGCHPDQPDLRCVVPDGHYVHWDGQREIWLSPTVADDQAIAAAERRGYDRAVANLRDEIAWREWRRALHRADPARFIPGALTDADRNGAADYLEATKETTL